MTDRCPTDIYYEFHGMEQRNYNPIEIARQYAPKFDKPAVDMVEVVRCKDCKHHEDEEVDMVYCPNIVGGWVGNDFFCADGERETEVENG